MRARTPQLRPEAGERMTWFGWVMVVMLVIGGMIELEEKSKPGDALVTVIVYGALITLVLVVGTGRGV